MVMLPKGTAYSHSEAEIFQPNAVQPFNTVPYSVMTPPTIKLFSSLFHNCNFATFINHKYLICRLSDILPLRKGI